MSQQKFDWIAIQAEWEAGKSAYWLANRPGYPSRSAITKRARNEEWFRDLDGEINERVAETVAGVAETGNLAERDAAICREADIRAAVEIRHRADLAGVAALLSRAIADADTKGKNPHKKGEKIWLWLESSYARLAKIRMETVEKATSAMSQIQERERIAYRLDAGGSSPDDRVWITRIVDPKQ